jgi:endoglucanase
VPLYAGEFCFFDFLDLWGRALQGFNDRGVLWPHLYTDDAATIQSRWRTFTTAGHFQPNTNFINTVKQYT